MLPSDMSNHGVVIGKAKVALGPGASKDTQVDMHSEVGLQTALVDEFSATIAVLANVSVVLTPSVSSHLISSTTDKVAVANCALEGAFYVVCNEMGIQISIVLEGPRTLGTKPIGNFFVIAFYMLAQFFGSIKGESALRSETSKWQYSMTSG